MGRRTVGPEAYYTPVPLVKECLTTVDNFFPLASFRLIVEPSAGDGAFYDLLPSSRIGIDIASGKAGIVATDFLLWEPEEKVKEAGTILVVGNPPFGARGSLAVKFIQHAALFADVIAFILPMSFNKDTFQDRVPSLFHLAYSKDCTSRYLHDGVLAEVHTVFQIWEKKDTARLKTVRLGRHDDFILKHAHMSRVTEEEREVLYRDYDFAIAQVGSNFRPKKPSDVKKGSHWFVKANTPQVESIFKLLDFSFLKGKNTAHMSLSKKDIVEAYIRAAEQNFPVFVP